MLMSKTTKEQRRCLLCYKLRGNGCHCLDHLNPDLCVCQANGFLLVQVKHKGYPEHVEIQKCDDCGKFKTDGQAVKEVMRQLGLLPVRKTKTSPKRKSLVGQTFNSVTEMVNAVAAHHGLKRK